MKKSKTTKKDYLLGIGSFIAMCLILALGVFAYNGGFSNKNIKYKVDNKQVSSGLTSRQIAYRFILAEGNMGQISHLRYSDIADSSAINQVTPNRLNASLKAQKYIAANSSYLEDYDKEDIQNYTQSVSTPEYFSIDKNTVLLSNPTNTSKTKIIGLNGVSHYYDTQIVHANFISNAYIIAKTADDTSWKGDYAIKRSRKGYNNVKLVLIQQEGEWRIYSVSDTDDISTRFATWQPATQKQVMPNYSTIKTLNKGETLNGLK